MADIEKFIQKIEKAKDKSKEYGLNEIRMTIEFADVLVELLKEQEAEWIYGEDETGVDGWRCSECNFFEPWFYEFDDDIDFIKRYDYCPKCGRRMTSFTGKQEGR